MTNKFITEIQLRNFKNFRHLKVNFDSLNVLVGANASGKSNFIQALKFVRDIYQHGLDNAISLQGGFDYLRRNTTPDDEKTSISLSFSPYKDRVTKENDKKVIQWELTTIKYSIELQKDRDNDSPLFNEKIEYCVTIFLVNNKQKEKYQNIRFSLQNKQGKLKNNGYGKPVKLTIQGNETVVFQADSFFAVLPSFELLRKNFKPEKLLMEQYGAVLIPNGFDFSIYDFDIKTIKKPASLIGKKTLDENGENLTNVIQHIIESREKMRMFSNLVKDMLPFISDFDVEKRYDKSVLLKINETFNPGMSIPGSLLSDGTISVTALIVALFFEYNRFSVYEEPEQGIHPALIARLMNLFYDASEKKQILITTHNPELVKNTKLENLLLLVRKESGETEIVKPYKKDMVTSFLDNELELDDLFVQNLLDV